MIWLVVIAAWAALCFVAYCIVCAGGIKERRAERILRDLAEESERQLVEGDCPWPIREYR